MATKNTFTITDYSDENTSFGVVSIDLTAGNLVAQQTFAADFAAAVDDLIIGELVKQQMTMIPLDTPAVPSNIYAQRELKWEVTYVGAVSGKKFQVEIGTPDLTENVVLNSDQADLTSDDWVALSSAWSAFVKSPDNGTEATTILSAKLVGRNL